MSDEKKIPSDDVSATSEPEAASNAAAKSEAADPVLPAASVSTLVTMLGTQAMVALGQFRMPGEKSPSPVRKNLARHYIDTLAVLKEKMNGNLTPDEAQILEAALHDLRMLYVNAR